MNPLRPPSSRSRQRMVGKVGVLSPPPCRSKYGCRRPPPGRSCSGRRRAPPGGGCSGRRRPPPGRSWYECRRHPPCPICYGRRRPPSRSNISNTWKSSSCWFSCVVEMFFSDRLQSRDVPTRWIYQFAPVKQLSRKFPFSWQYNKQNYNFSNYSKFCTNPSS